MEWEGNISRCNAVIKEVQDVSRCQGGKRKKEKKKLPDVSFNFLARPSSRIALLVKIRFSPRRRQSAESRRPS